MKSIVKPSTEELNSWLLSTLRHSCQVEYYLERLDLGKSDMQRPHDINGEGNKYCWDVARGLAMQHRSQDLLFFRKIVLPSIQIHRTKQYHHRMWNQESSDATVEDLKAGAVDAICSLLDNRAYQGGRHSFEEIIGVIKKNENHKHKWFWMVYSRMRKLEPPKTDTILSLEDFPNIGIGEDNYNKIKELTRQTVIRYRALHGYRI